MSEIMMEVTLKERKAQLTRECRLLLGASINSSLVYSEDGLCFAHAHCEIVFVTCRDCLSPSYIVATLAPQCVAEVLSKAHPFCPVMGHESRLHHTRIWIEYACISD